MKLKLMLAAVALGGGVLAAASAATAHHSFATLGFAVLYSTLVLYATKHLNLDTKLATTLMGVFGAFNYGLHLFGGYLGGRFLSNRNLFVGGMALQVFGCACIALGTLAGIRACLQRKFGTEEVGRYSFAVQGVGSVGYNLVKLLRAEGAKVFVTDINQERVEPVVDELRAEAVPMHQIYDVDATVFSPCAMGGIINEDTAPRLKCKIVAGGANNQLESNECGTLLEQRGILYAPDYAINSGGLMNLAIELQGYDENRARRMVGTIYDIIGRNFRQPEEGLGFDGSPVAHMWRTIIWPTRTL